MVSKQQILDSSAFREFLVSVQEELNQQQPDRSLQQQNLTAERSRLDDQCRGWRMSLGNPELGHSARTALEADLAAAMERVSEIDRKLQTLSCIASQVQAAVDPDRVADRLLNLEEILSGENASAMNIYLAQHIAAIQGHPEGRVVIRVCKLGVLGDLQDLPLQRGEESVPGSEDETPADHSRQRRRMRREVGVAIPDDDVADAANDFAVDPQRFAGLGPEWFSEDVFHVPRRLSWSESHV